MRTMLHDTARRRYSDKGLRIIARSLFKELKDNGFDHRQIVSLSSELIGLVTSDMQDRDDTVAAAS